MSDTLTTLTTRLQVLLDDPDAAIWPGDVLEECLRWGLGQIQRVCPTPLTIAGLDGALQSNLDQELCLSPLLLQLAQQQAWQHRQVQRSESFHPDPQRLNSEQLAPISQEGLQMVLEQVRRYFLQRSPTVPY